VEDGLDNSELRGNSFLQKEIIDHITQELARIGISAFSQSDHKSKLASHVLVLKSGGVSERTFQRPVVTTQSYHSGFNAQGQACNYSTPKVSGGGTYTRRNITVTATLYMILADGKLSELCRSYAKGDGQNCVERELRSTVLMSNKKLGDRYIRVFTDTALSVFQSSKGG